MIHTGDAIEVMRTMPSESVDAIVTDPPAGISFMSKHWDRDKGGRTQWVAWMTEVMVECHRLLKPGGYAVVWSLPRTCHWTAWAMEDGGFIIRDQLAHIFASGFPKGRAQLKPAREDWWLARKPGPLQPLQIDATRIAVDPNDPVNGAVWTARAGVIEGSKPASHKKMMVAPDGTKLPATAGEKGRWPSNLLLSDPELFDEPNPFVVGSGADATRWFNTPDNLDRESPAGMFGVGERPQSTHYGDSGGYSRFFIIPKSDRKEREGGLRTTCDADHVDSARSDSGVVDQRSVARRNTHPTVKPLDLMRHLIRLVTPHSVPCLVCQGCGGTVEYTHAIQRSSTERPELQVRGVRDSVLLGSEGDQGPAGKVLQSDLLEQMDRPNEADDEGMVEDPEGLHRGVESEAPDGDEDRLHPPASSGDGRSAGPESHKRRGSRSPERDQGRQPPGESTSSEQAGSRQPTEATEEADQVSSLPLDDPDIGPCQLCGGRLAAGERRGVVLDPFLGSGSTAIAAELEGFPWIGIEKEPEYVAIAEARLNGTQRGLGLDTPLVGEPRKSSVNPSGEFGRNDKPHWFGTRAGERSVYGYDGPPREKKPKPASPPGMFDEEPAA